MQEKKLLPPLKNPEGTRRLKGEDATEYFLGRFREFIRNMEISDLDLRKTYFAFWNDRIGAKALNFAAREGMAIFPDIEGEIENISLSNHFEGWLPSPPTTNTSNRNKTRSIFIPAKDGSCGLLIKGTGARMIVSERGDYKDQFGRIPGKEGVPFEGDSTWKSLGGLMAGHAAHDFMVSLLIAEVFHSVHGYFPEVRVPLKIVDINAALETENKGKKIEKHVQSVYVIDTPVRSSYSRYVKDLKEFWLGTNLSTEAGKTEAVSQLNRMLTAHPNRYKVEKELCNELSMGDVLSVRDSQNRTIFEVIKQYDELMSGEYSGKEPTEEQIAQYHEQDGPQDDDDTTYSEQEQIEQVQLRQHIEDIGIGLASKFYEKNEKLVLRTVLSEAKKLGALAGVCYATGINVGESFLGKDASGSMIADFDSASFFSKESKETELKDIMYNGFDSIYEFAQLHGVDRSKIGDVIKTFLKSCCESFGATMQKMDQIPLYPSYTSEVISQMRNRVAHYRTVSSINDAGFFELLVLTYNKDILYKALGVDIIRDMSASSDAFLVQPGFATSSFDEKFLLKPDEETRRGVEFSLSVPVLQEFSFLE